MSENGKELGLKWHKFLIYFSLWLGAIGFWVSSVVVATGLMYKDKKDAVYQVFPLMQWLNVGYAFVLIFLGIYTIYVRYQLAGFVKDAPKKLLFITLASPVISLIYLLIMSMIMNVPFVQIITSSDVLRDFSSALIFFMINKIYYNNRKELFVN